MAIDFPNGTGNYLVTGNNPSNLSGLGGGTAMSWMAWIRADTLPGTRGTAIGFNNNASGFYFFHVLSISVLSGGSFEIAAYTSTTGSTNLTGGSCSTGTWYHVAGILDTGLSSSHLKLYVDGSNVSSATQQGTIGSSLNYLTIGANNNSNPYSATEFFDGKVADVRIYNRAITANELEAIRLSNGANWSVPGCIFHAPMIAAIDGSVPTSVLDIFGTSLTITGSPAGFASPHCLPGPILQD